jgi:hypothetical protein
MPTGVARPLPMQSTLSAAKPFCQSERKPWAFCLQSINERRRRSKIWVGRDVLPVHWKKRRDLTALIPL